ncbi:glycosyltransferase family 2 protein, partial [Leptolyngbya sp. FACHB-36]|uniref:glycosyltransferase n=1 Tax=Leptolyngbya sp. FACHB-36 TaxID=2692808 RepID=UPI001680F3C8
VRSIACLAAQDPPPTDANEVILIDSGDTPPDLLDQLCQRYPWIQVHLAPPGMSYYKAKMLGAELATGDIIVYYDSDCLYDSAWLRTILKPFTRPELPSPINIVAGETMTRGVGPYGTAMALGYIFPPFSGETDLAPTSQYFLNNVAFRRKFLLKHPIPVNLPLYRGNCAIHACELRQQGFTIWRQPQARTTHAPPNGLSHFVWRFLLIGQDYYWQKRLLVGRGNQTSDSVESDPTMSGMAGKLRVFRDRLRRLWRVDPHHILFLPVALPIVLASTLLIYVGYLLTSWKPAYLLKTYTQFVGD